MDSWLMLLEKMVNPKTVLETPHTLPKTASKTTGGNYKPFDPLKYLTRTHRLAFQAVMKIWGKKPLKTYGARMSESVLTILCHILKGEPLANSVVQSQPISWVSNSEHIDSDLYARNLHKVIVNPPPFLVECPRISLK